MGVFSECKGYEGVESIAMSSRVTPKATAPRGSNRSSAVSVCLGHHHTLHLFFVAIDDIKNVLRIVGIMRHKRI